MLPKPVPKLFQILHEIHQETVFLVRAKARENVRVSIQFFGAIRCLESIEVRLFPFCFFGAEYHR